MTKTQNNKPVSNFENFPPKADPPLAENLDIVSNFDIRISDL